MRAMKIVLDDKAVYLRLSASKLAEYAKEIGSGGNTLFAVMDALDDLEKQAALFAAALNYKGNPNEIHDGFELIDMLAVDFEGHEDFRQILLNLPLLLAGFLVKILFFFKKGYGKTYLKGLYRGLQLSLSREGRLHRQDFSGRSLRCLLRIQWKLWENTVRRFTG